MFEENQATNEQSEPLPKSKGLDLKAKILSSRRYNSGRPFRPIEMATHLDQNPQKIAEALGGIRDNGRIGYDGVRYWRLMDHWINKSPLNNARKLRKEYRLQMESRSMEGFDCE